MPTLQELEAELQGHDANLKEIEEILAVMPDSQDALDMKADVLTQKRDVQQKIALLKPNDTASEPIASPEESVDPVDYNAAGRQEASQGGPQQLFKVNEHVVAKYAGDRQFYPATVVAVMGSASAPVYTVKFKGYSGTETVRWNEVKPAITPSSSGGQKRKADGSPAVSTPVAPPSPGPPPPAVAKGSTLSAPAHIDAALAAQIKKEPSKVSDGPPRGDKPVKKVKTNKALDKAKNSWQDWQKKTSGNSKVAKVANKESMFRTGEDHNARVGFTGSGKTMTKDIARAKHKYDVEDSRI